MQTIDQRMAQWRMTGGALDAAAHEESGRDDGLKAAPTARGAYGCGFADDGLQATAFTTPGSAWCYQGDDGLKAAVTINMRCPFTVDDGLMAYTPTVVYRGCVGGADDGLMAGGYSISFCPVM